MSDTNTMSGAMHHVPTLRERIWRKLGFRYHLGAEPEDIEKLTGWMCTDSRLDFSLADRIRLLVSGRLRLRLVQHTTVQVEDTKNRFDWHILAPGERYEVSVNVPMKIAAEIASTLE